MNNSEVFVGLVASIGTMVTLLAWLIRQQHQQVERLTDRFVTALQTTVVENTKAQVQLVGTLSELTVTVRELRDNDRAEHTQILDGQRAHAAETLAAIGKADRRGLEAV